MRRHLRCCLAVARRDLRLARSYRYATLVGIASGLLGLLVHRFVARLVGAEHASSLAGGGYFPFVCTGIVLQSLVVSCAGAMAGALAREAGNGSLEPALATGASPVAIAIGAALTPSATAALQAALYLGMAAWALGLRIHPAGLAGGLLALAVTWLATLPFGLLGAAAWVVTRRPGLVTTALGLALGLLGGVYFPVSLLPHPLASWSRWIPLTAGLEALRAAWLGGAGAVTIAPLLARVAFVAALATGAGLFALEAALERSRRRGNLAWV